MNKQMFFTTELNQILCSHMRDYGSKAKFLFTEVSPELLGLLRTSEFAGTISYVLDASEKCYFEKTGEIPLPETFDYIFMEALLQRTINKSALLDNVRQHLRGNGKLLGIECTENLYGLQETAAALKQYYEDVHFFQIPQNKIYVYKAAKYFLSEKTSWLRSFFSPDIRMNLVWLLRRVENDIDLEGNCQAVLMMCEQYNIPDDYLQCLVNETMLNAEKVWSRLGKKVGNGDG